MAEPFTAFATGVTALSALSGLSSGKDSAKTANRLHRESLEIQREQLEFAQRRYRDFRRIFGPIEENLTEFFQELTPEFFESRGLSAFQTQFEAEQQKLEEFFVANEIETGVRSSLQASMGLEAAKERARIEADAPIKVAEAKQSFLSLGAAREDTAATNVVNAGNNLSTVLSNQANIATSSAEAGFNSFQTGLTDLAGIADDFITERNNTPSANEGETQNG